MNNNPYSPDFILGVERCGSTWLSNIFDSSPEVLFYMEPFADFAEIFPGFPGRLAYMTNKSEYLEDIIVNGFNNLYSYKYPLLDGHKTILIHRLLTHLLLLGQDKMLRLAKGRSSLIYVRHALLSLHQSKKKGRNIKKNRYHKNIVVKELRLNFKIGLLKSVFPQSKYIVIIRNPVSQLNSIMGLFERGSLYQLRQELYVFFEYIENCSRFSKYYDVLKELDSARLFDRLVAYWFINYNTLVEDLAAYQCRYTIVRHENLCNEADAVAKDLFNFFGCCYSNTTEEYIIESSSYANRATSPLDTRRNSKQFHVEAFIKATENIGAAFLKASKGFWEKSPKEIQQYESIICG